MVVASVTEGTVPVADPFALRASHGDVRWAVLRAALGRDTENGPEGRLDLHEGISHPDPREGCPRWPERLFLRSNHGEMVPGRCKSTNLCDYCARLAAVENAEVLALDAMTGVAPTMWAVLTTRTATTDLSSFYKSRECVQRALRRRWSTCEYAALIEYTTGFGSASGGLRRPHWNVLLKGIPSEDLDEAAAIIRRVWCSREDAEPQAQSVKLIEDAGGLMRYIALHFQKESQSPPPGFRGHRFVKSRGYLGKPTPEAREEARRALQFKRYLWHVARLCPQLADPNRTPAEAFELEMRAREMQAQADATTWELVDLGGGTDLDPAALDRQRARDDFRRAGAKLRGPGLPA